MNKYPTNIRFRVCNNLPKDKRILDALEYAGDTIMVPVSGLTHGVIALPGRLLRAAFCIKNLLHDIRDKAVLYHRNFEIQRDGGSRLNTSGRPEDHVYGTFKPVIVY